MVVQEAKKNVFNRFNKKIFSTLSFLFGTISFFVAIVVFYFAVSELTSVSVGSFIGNGNLDVTILGEGISMSTNCNWGPGLGFYLIIISTFILISLSFKNFNKTRCQSIIKFICKKFRQ